ncbi:MAG: TlpA family protein disulfide reductase [Flavobacteriaceae bacterium]|nr:TlpA family protein disulfide reductase [Flavobacteriaceae bacterium]
MKLNKSKRSNMLFLVVIALLIIPTTRHPIQIALHTIFSQFGPSVIDKEDQKKITDSNWNLRALNGDEINFIDTKGKVVFVNLWATWCPPCIAEFQGIQDLYHDYNDKVEFLLVSDESPEIINKFLDKKGYDIKIYNPLSAYPSFFEARSIPRTYLIDKSGHIVIDKKGAANWNSNTVRSQLDQLLK